jgi:hypothetical protein
MRRLPVAFREDACPSLLVASTITPQVHMIITWGHHPPPMGFHEQQMEHARFDTRLTTIEEG